MSKEKILKSKKSKFNLFHATDRINTSAESITILLQTTHYYVPLSIKLDNYIINLVIIQKI